MGVLGGALYGLPNRASQMRPPVYNLPNEASQVEAPGTCVEGRVALPCFVSVLF